MRGMGFFDSCSGDSGGPIWKFMEDEVVFVILVNYISLSNEVCKLYFLDRMELPEPFFLAW